MDKNRVVRRKRLRRAARTRKRVRGDAERPRLSVFRSNRHIYAQIINDEDGRTLVAASTHEDSLVSGLKHGGGVEAAKRVGKAIAEKALSSGVSAVAFDRGGYQYHGRVAALAAAAREAGLNF